MAIGVLSGTGWSSLPLTLSEEAVEKYEDVILYIFLLTTQMCLPYF